MGCCVRNSPFFMQTFPSAQHHMGTHCYSRSGAEVEQALQQQGIRVYHSDQFLCGKREMQAFLRVALSTEPDMGRLENGLSILRKFVKKS